MWSRRHKFRLFLGKILMVYVEGEVKNTYPAFTSFFYPDFKVESEGATLRVSFARLGLTFCFFNDFRTHILLSQSCTFDRDVCMLSVESKALVKQFSKTLVRSFCQTSCTEI